MKPFSHSGRGEAFEQKVFALLSEQLSSGQLGLEPSCVSIARRSKHFSRDRNDHIVFDIGIEVRLPKASKPSLLWLWECKDYSHSVPVDDIEEFYAKLQQVGGANIKGGLITPSSLQAGALAYAQSRGIAVVRVLPEDQIDWVCYSMDRFPSEKELRQRHIWQTIDALTQQGFSIDNHWGVFINCDNKYPYNITELARQLLQLPAKT